MRDTQPISSFRLALPDERKRGEQDTMPLSSQDTMSLTYNDEQITATVPLV